MLTRVKSALRLIVHGLEKANRVPGLKLHNDRVVRLLETLLYPGGFVRDWMSRTLHARVVARHHLIGDEYRRYKLRYDLSKSRAKGFVERIGKSRRYSLTPLGLKLAVLLVKLPLRLLGLLASLINPADQRAYATAQFGQCCLPRGRDRSGPPLSSPRPSNSMRKRIPHSMPCKCLSAGYQLG
jgi:hypothetical protein